MTKKIPLLHLEKGLYLQVNGEEEKKHTLSWDILKKIGDNTQNLINKIALYSLEDIPLDVKSFKLDFVGFHPGSAIPEFKLHEAVQSNLFPVKKEAYTIINADSTFIVTHLNDGNFQAIADRYNSPAVKNDIVEAVYEFSNSAGTKPFGIVKPIPNTENKFKPIAKLRTISPEIRKLLQVVEPKLIENINPTEDVEAVSKVLIKTNSKGKTTKKISKLYTEKEASLALKFDSIEINDTIYTFKNEVHFSLHENKKNVSIENPMLDIYASGEDINEAEKDLFEQFDYTFKRLNQIEDGKLSNHLLNSKNYINLIVDSVKEK